MIDHYYYFLMENLDNSTICHTMLKLELITEIDVIDSAKMYSEYQKNSFLLDQLLISDALSIIEFCRMIQDTENKQDIGKMLVNGKGMKYLMLSYIFVNYSNTINIY